MADIGSARAESVAAQIAEQGGEVMPMTVDVSSGTEVGALFDSTVSRFGRLDLMFNNAGITCGPCPARMVDPSSSDVTSRT